MIKVLILENSDKIHSRRNSDKHDLSEFDVSLRAPILQSDVVLYSRKAGGYIILKNRFPNVSSIDILLNKKLQEK